MNYSAFVRKLVLPPGFAMPTRLEHEDLVAEPLTREDLQDDVRGVNASLDLIRRTRGGDWPAEPVSEEFDYVDLVWHELEFRDGTSFAYVVRNRDGGYLGCCYLYPMGHRTELTEELLHHDVDVSWWVTTDGYDGGYYERLYGALRRWLQELPFDAPYWSNAEVPPAERPEQQDG